MPFSVQPSVGYGYVRFTDPISPDDARDAIRAVSAATKKPPERRILFHFPDGTPRLSIVEVFNLAQELGDLGLRREDWVAAVLPDSDLRDWAITLGQNRGWRRVRWFGDLPTAEAWLSAPAMPN